MTETLVFDLKILRSTTYSRRTLGRSRFANVLTGTVQEIHKSFAVGDSLTLGAVTTVLMVATAGPGINVQLTKGAVTLTTLVNQCLLLTDAYDNVVVSLPAGSDPVETKILIN